MKLYFLINYCKQNLFFVLNVGIDVRDLIIFNIIPSLDCSPVVI